MAKMTKRELSAHLEQEINAALGYKDGKLIETSTVSDGTSTKSTSSNYG